MIDTTHVQEIKRLPEGERFIFHLFIFNDL
jgi:hypothetical protein